MPLNKLTITKHHLAKKSKTQKRKKRDPIYILNNYLIIPTISQSTNRKMNFNQIEPPSLIPRLYFPITNTHFHFFTYQYLTSTDTIHNMVRWILIGSFTNIQTHQHTLLHYKWMFFFHVFSLFYSYNNSRNCCRCRVRNSIQITNLTKK